jgi:tetratricopeptide (TPR) repeat protein
VNRASIYRTQGNLALALADFSMAIELAPNNVGALLSRGALYTEQGNYELALADYNAVLAIDATQLCRRR